LAGAAAAEPPEPTGFQATATIHPYGQFGVSAVSDTEPEEVFHFTPKRFHTEAIFMYCLILQVRNVG
jgi:hypothetical protein